jgi:WD40 repeat protein
VRYPGFEPTAPIRAHPQDMLLWSVPDQTLVRTFSGVCATSLQFSPDNSRVLVADRYDEPQGRVAEWDLDADPPLWSLTVADTRVYTAAYNPAGDRIAVGFADGVGVVARGETEVAPTMAREIVYPAATFSPDGRWLATSGLALWRASDWMKAWTTALEPPPPTDTTLRDSAVVFSPDGATILSSDADILRGSILQNSVASTKLYRAADGVLLRDLGALPRRPMYSPDGAWILAGDLVWEMATGRVVSLHPDTRPTSVSVFLSDGRIALGREDGIIEMFCPH